MDENMIKNVLENAPGDMEISGKVTGAQLLQGLWETVCETWQAQVLYDFTHFLRNGQLDEAKDLLDRFSLFFAVVFVLTFSVCYFLASCLFGSSESATSSQKEAEEKEELPDPRDFTVEQLRDFNGVKNPSIYVALKGDVYDVTKSAEYYGPEGPYHCFAGRNATRAMAKLSFEESELSNPDYSSLGPFERDTLEDWVSKFKHYKAYPIVGRLSEPLPFREYQVSDLAAFRGKQKKPDERIHSPILVGVKGQVFDVSFGGYEMYSEGSGYHVFAGKEASRSLALMSLKEEDSLSTDLSDLTETNRKTLDDWERKFKDVKKYPIVGKIIQQ